MRWFWLLFIVLVSAAQAQTYLPQPDMATCLARSQAQCQALGCDGVNTRYWWTCIPLMDGTAAIEVRPGSPFDATTTNLIARTPVGLSGAEQGSLQTKEQIAPKLPPDTNALDKAIEAR